MKTFLALLLMVISAPCWCQPYTVTGTVRGPDGSPAARAQVSLWQKDSMAIKQLTDKEGKFILTVSTKGLRYISITAPGAEEYFDSILVTGNISLGEIRLLPKAHMLDEVSVAEKVLAMVQKDDTLEYNSGAFKVNPDADAADLVRKMPAIQINDKQVTAQGENVIKILVDGKPFFGNDPYGSLKNLPADIIDKVQVYNEKSDQEQFTGFREGGTSKTINIITKPGKRKGVFGTAFGGYGTDNSRQNIYGAGTTLNKFGGDKRITFTAQANNINIQNFSSDNATAGSSSAGISETKAAGLNYSNKWGKKTEISGSYSFNNVNNSVSRGLRKTYLIAADSGQVYDEVSPSAQKSYSHRLHARITYTIDSANSLLFVPVLSVSNNESATLRLGSTRESATPVNTIADSNTNKSSGLSFSGSLLYRHKFLKKGRTFSMNVTTGINTSDGNSLHTAQSIYYASPALNNTLDQQALQMQHTINTSANATYTEPIQKDGMLKVEYNISYTPARSERGTYDYDYISQGYTIPNDQFSNTFSSANTAHKAGISYMYRAKKAEFSLGLNYQLTQLRNDQVQPFIYRLSQDFQNLLPVATFQYKLSATANLNCTYSTSTQPPSVSQLQNIVSNTDPLHLHTGNPALKQPYQHNLTVRYNLTGKDAKNNCAISLTGAYTQNYITTNSIIAAQDTTIAQNIVLAKGSQLTLPVNTDGYSHLNTYISYGFPFSAIKCRINFSVSGGISNVPSVINSRANSQQNKNGGLGVSISSNISDHIDFMLSSNTNVVANANSINRQLNTTYVSESCKASVNLIMWKGIVFSSAVSYQTNSGISSGYNQNYVLWNMSIGKKLFRHQQGDIRLSVFDMLNENNNIQHIVSDIYIQDVRSNTLQRYFLLVFTYKLREFKK